jgi:hypothetical protein
LAASESPSSSESPLPQVEVGVLDSDTTASAGEVTTDGESIVWSGVPDGGEFQSVIFRLDPRTHNRTELYRSQDPNSVIAGIAALGQTLAFVEVAEDAAGDPSWTLKLVRDGADPITADSNDLPPGVPGILPLIALGDEHVVWATTHAGGASDTRQCELLSMTLDDARRATIASSSCDQTEYWYPDLEGSRLVYGTVEYQSDGSDDRHVYLVELGSSDAEPERLDDDGEASMPVLADTHVYWKTARRQFSMLNWGTLEVHSLEDGTTGAVGFNADDPDALIRPSVGDRYVAAELFDSTVVAVFDVVNAETLIIEQSDPSGSAVFAGPRISGDLLVWLYSSDFTGANREIHWALLPNS